MHITNIKGTNMDLTEAIKDYATKKVEALQKYLADFDPIDVTIEVGQTTRGQNKGPIFRAEVNLTIPGTLLRAEETAEDLYAAIDLVKDQLQRQIVDFKNKLSDKTIRATRPGKE